MNIGGKTVKRKYPMKWFLRFALINFLFRFFCFSVPGVILCVLGIWIYGCLWIGVAVLLIAIGLSMFEQLRIAEAATAESDNPEFNELMDAFCGEGGIWAVGGLLNQKISESTSVETEEEN